MTDRSSEERSRWTAEYLKFAPWAEKEFSGEPLTQVACERRDAAWRAWQARAALDAPETWQTATGYPDGTLKITPGRIPGVPSEAKNDRQEGAPEAGLRIDNLINYAANLQSDTIYLDPDDIAFIHEYYGCKTGCCTKFAGKIMRPKVGAVPGVPSEATPGKENAPLEYCDHGNATSRKKGDCGMTPECRAELTRKFCPACGSSNFQGHDKTCPFPEGFTDDEGFTIDNGPDRGFGGATRYADLPAPAPEVQGTPTKNPWFCKICGVSSGPCEHWDAHEIARVTGAPVGPPQKETPPNKAQCGCDACTYQTKVINEVAPTPSMPYGAGAQNFGAVPEEIQGKEPEYAGTEDAEPEGDFVGIGRNGPTVRPAPEPQTFDAFWADRGVPGEAANVWQERFALEIWGYALDPKVSKEAAELLAAGRRSAITELQETVADWGRRSRDASFVEACDWCLKKCAELQEKTK